MKPLISVVKKVGSLITITIFVSFICGGAFCSEPDTIERQMQNGSRVMAPGWINIDKQRSKELKEQTLEKQISPEEQIRRIDADLETSLTERTADAVTPDIKGPKGSGSDTAKITGVLTDTGEGIPFWNAEAMEKVFEEARSRGASATTLDNGTTVTIWREKVGDTWHNYFKIVDEKGDSLLKDADGKPTHAEFTLDGDYDYISAYGVTDMGNGKFGITVNGSKYKSWYDNITSQTGSNIRVWNHTSNSIQSVRVYDTTATNALDSLSEHIYESFYTSIFDRGSMSRSYSYKYNTVNNLTSLGGGEYVMSVDRSESNGAYQYKFSSNGRYLQYVSGSWDNDYDSFIAVTDETLDYDYTGDDSNKHFLEQGQTGNWADGDYSYNYSYVNAITSLGDGKFVYGLYESKGWQEGEGYNWSEGTYLNVMDTNLNIGESRYFENTYDYGYDDADNWYSKSDSRYLSNLVSLGNGNYAAAWNEDMYDRSHSGGIYKFDWDSKITVEKYYADRDTESFDLGSAYDYSRDGDNYNYQGRYISDMEVLDDGTLYIAMNEYEYTYNYSTREASCKRDASLARIGSDKDVVETVDLGLGDAAERTISNLTKTRTGDLAFVMDESRVSESGESTSKTSVHQVSTGGDTKDTGKTLSLDEKSATTESKKLASNVSADTASTTSLKSAKTDTSALAVSLDSDNLSAKLSLKADDLSVEVTTANTLLNALGSAFNKGDALAIYGLFKTGIDGNAAMLILANIMKNPTAEQKEMLDAVTALLSNLEKVGKDAEDAETAQKATEEFAKIAAVALIAQALPDLFSEGDMVHVRGLFNELSGTVGSIVNDYEASIDVYYNELKKDIAANMTLLQLKNVLSKEMTKEQLDKLPRGQIEKILKKIREVKDKTYTEEHILKREAKHREKYIEPKKKLMEENIKKVVQDFSHRITSVLNTAAIEK